ncbi:MAG: divalent-cation tolerance protein CutA [Alphaproteobacteria bacterium]|nr:divalent-cation tolerance protein CutA [Alphaproteobacteria bacterium]
MSEFCSVYITVPDEEAGQTIARGLIDRRLVACVNMIPGLTSIYRWQGRIEEGEELCLIAKARMADFEEISACVNWLHPDDVPCIVAWPIEAGLEPYLDWLRSETERKAGS